MAYNVFEEIKRMLPVDVTEFVTVNSVSDGVSNVTSLRQFTFDVQGDSVAVGNNAWVKGGVIVGEAPSGMSTYNVVI